MKNFEKLLAAANKNNPHVLAANRNNQHSRHLGSQLEAHSLMKMYLQHHEKGLMP